MVEGDYREYWERNLSDWGALYLDASHGRETLFASKPFAWLYRRAVVPFEARLMRRRYDLTLAFIETYARPGAVVSDIGCGTGIFTVALLRRGCRVQAIDFSHAALDATRNAVEANCPEAVDRVSYHHLDVARDALPKSDLAFAMGVTPYIEDIEAFYQNVFASTGLLYVLLVDPSHWINRLRTVMPVLNVRRLQFFAPARADDLIARHDWRLVVRRRFASGYLDLVAAPGVEVDSG